MTGRRNADAPDVLAALAQRAVAGHADALEALLLALLPRARNLIRYLVRGDRDVDDIAQNALYTIARRLVTFEGRGSFTAWADRVVARITFHEIKQRARAASFAAGPALDGLPPGPDAATPYEHLERRRLVRLLDRLPHEQRAALVLHHVVGLTVPEIAAETGVPLETVRSRLRVGRERLRALSEPADGKGAGHA